MNVEVRALEARDADGWLRLRCELWPDSDEEHRREVHAWLRGEGKAPAAVLVASDGNEIVGFVELSIRAFAEGCETSDVAYVEGWYVSPGWRRQGVGRALVRAAEEWGRARGCREIASDTAPDNSTSIVAHRGLGFRDAGLIRCFAKRL